MKRTWLTTMLAAALALTLTAPGVWADDKKGADVDVKAGPVRVNVDTQKERDAKRERGEDRRADRASDITYRATKINGMTVKNHEGKELGDVKDIVIDVRNGRVRYAAVSFGGFLGIGDKLFAVPWNAFECQQTEDGAYLVLDVTEEQMKNAPGFDQETWPNFADAGFIETNDKFYRGKNNKGAVKQPQNKLPRNQPLPKNE